jgi:class 3 adenylate cyclase
LFGITRRSVVSASNVDHRQHAVLAAIAILDALRGFNEQLAASNQQPIKIGIGIASGSVIAGYAGTRHRATYTCVGDTVNRAARIEEHTKQLHVPVLFDEETRAGLSAAVPVTSLGEFTLRGKAIPVGLHTPAALSGADQSAR